MKTLFIVQSNTLGKGQVFVKWNAPATYLAIVGSTRRVLIYTRQGKVVTTLSLSSSGQVIAMDWDAMGETLAVLQRGSSEVFLFDMNTRKTETIETNLKELTFMKWSHEGQILALGSFKGTLLIYNRKNLKITPIKGKHSKKINEGVWSSENNLALCSDDMNITLSNEQGDTLFQKQATRIPSDLKLSSLKGTEQAKVKDTTISAIIDGKYLWLIDYTSPKDQPLELEFRREFGAISSHLWFGDGYILVGFRSGCVVIISTHVYEIGNELSTCKMSEEVIKVAYCDSLKKGACIGGNEVIVFDMSKMELDLSKSDKIEVNNEYGTLNDLQWTPDGQILTVTSVNGNVYNFLTSIPMLYDVHNRKVLHLTALREFCITDTLTNQALAKFETDVEPSVCGIGDRYCAVGMNNRIWFYNYQGNLVTEREVLGTIDKIDIGYEFSGVLTGGKILLIQIESVEESGTSIEDKNFPDTDRDVITCFSLTPDFLIYGTNRGSIYFYSLFDQVFVSEFRTEGELPITNLFPNTLGTKVVVFDEIHQAFMYNPVNDRMTPIDKLGANVTKILWDVANQSHFVACSPGILTDFIYSNTRWGPKCFPVTDTKNKDILLKTEISEQLQPLLVNDGKVVCQQPNANLVTITLKPYDLLSRKLTSSFSLSDNFEICLALHKLSEAWSIANKIRKKDVWGKLAKQAIDLLDLEMALKIYRTMGDAKMVMTLEKLIHIDEINIVLGYLAALDRNFSEAEAKFLLSSQQHLALEMRRDLMHWDRALELAKKLGKEEQIAIISEEYASQLEIKGEFARAAELYESLSSSSAYEGLVRCLIRMGNISQGVKMVVDNGSKKLCRECAFILVEVKSWNEAAELFKKAEMYDKAAEIFIDSRNFSKVATLINQMQNPSLLSKYAEAREKDGKYVEAMEAYQKAGDLLSVIRLNLNHMNNSGKAIEIVKSIKSKEGAALIAQYCIDNKNYKRAIEFFILADKQKEAFRIAQTYDEMSTYAICVKSPTIDQLKAIALYFESKGQLEKAGDYYAQCDEIEKAVQLLLQDGREESISKAIDIIGQTDNNHLIHKMVDFLMGSIDGVAKNSKHIFRMYMALGNYEQASKTALDICKQQWEVGSYQVAHDIVFDIVRQLIKKKLHIPSELKYSLMLLHSYLIIKKLVEFQQPVLSASILLRIAKNASKFPNHLEKIFTSTVVQCYRADMKKSAFEYATILCRPEYRNKIEDKYKKMITTIVRKKKFNDEPETVQTSPCPNCEASMGCWETTCPNCKEDIPYCIVTGQHMVLHDWCLCPCCEFPAMHKYFIQFLQKCGTDCPMCKTKVDVSKLVQLSLSEAKAELQKWLEIQQ